MNTFQHNAADLLQFPTKKLEIQHLVSFSIFRIKQHNEIPRQKINPYSNFSAVN